MPRRGGRNRRSQSRTIVQRRFDLQLRYEDVMTDMALARYRWTGLPATCNGRYLEWVLLHDGVATIARPRGTELLLSLMCVWRDRPNMYMEPARWMAQGSNGTRFSCGHDSAVVVWDSYKHHPTYRSLQMYAEELADITLTRRVQRAQARNPQMIKGPQQYQQVMQGLAKQVMQGESYVIGTNGIDEIAVEPMVPDSRYDAEPLITDESNIWNRVYTTLGISNSTFKQERQTEDEVRGQHEPTMMVRRGGLDCRREAAERISWLCRDMLEKPIEVHWYEDFEDDNFNLMNDARRLLEGGDA